MSPDPLTPKQKVVLDFVGAFIRKHGFAPSINEICSGLDLSSTSTVHKHLKMLTGKGYLGNMPRRPRGLSLQQVPVRPVMAVEVPLLGNVSAGQPIEMNSIPETLELPESMLGKGETFVLRVKGDSMIDEAIKDGDFVIIEKRQTAHNGEMVIACIDNEEVTLKRLYREGARVRLQPSNPAMLPLIIQEKDISIKGVVIGVLRKYRRL